jgi:hypothetical protein
MPFTSAVLKSALPTPERMCRAHHFGKYELSVEEAQDRLNRREALMHSVILYSNFPQTHTLIPKLFSISLALSRGTRDVRIFFPYVGCLAIESITFLHPQLLMSCNLAGLSLGEGATGRAVNKLLALNEEAILEDWVRDVSVLFLSSLKLQ